MVSCFDKEQEEQLSEYVGHRHLSPEESVRSSHINTQEMWGVYAAVLRWGHLWCNSTIMFITDSTTVEAALKTGRSRSKQVMGYMYRLFWAAVEFNFEFKSIYIRSKDNVLCDALSRLEERGSVDRIKEVDELGYMCCSRIFNLPFRRSTAGAGTVGLPEGQLCPKLNLNKKYASEEFIAIFSETHTPLPCNYFKRQPNKQFT